MSGLFCCALLQNQRIEALNPSLNIYEPYLGLYGLQYPFLIPTDVDKQLLLSDLPST